MSFERNSSDSTVLQNNVTLCNVMSRHVREMRHRNVWYKFCSTLKYLSLQHPLKHPKVNCYKRPFPCHMLTNYPLLMAMHFHELHFCTFTSFISKNVEVLRGNVFT